MVEKISIKQYRKLKDLEIELSKGINVFSGTNGTSKTSMLHIISNQKKYAASLHHFCGTTPGVIT